MLRQAKDRICFDKYFERKFFIRPFVCKKCGNEFWFEHGCQPDLRIVDYSDRYLHMCSTISRDDKFCDICTIEIEGIFLKKPDANVRDILDWFNGIKNEGDE